MLGHQRERALRSLESKLGVSFSDLNILNEALTHSSYAHERGGIPYNERLEFLGDSVVGLVVSDILFSTYPEGAEGELARTKANLVSAASMAPIGRQLGLNDLLLLGKGEQRSRGRGRESILANAVEAVIGAVYIDQPWEVTHALVARLWHALLASTALSPEHVVDPKSALQELLQGKGQGTPEYRLKESFGPDHAKTFLSEVTHEGQVLAVGQGHSKKEAEQDAARKALGVFKRPQRF